MECHKKAVDHIAGIIENQGCKCIRNEQLESRIPDLKCCDTYIEVKATSTDLHSTRTKHQLDDIQKSANRLQKGAVLCNTMESKCIPLNKKGESFIDQYELNDYSRKSKSDESIGLGEIALGALLLDMFFNQGRGTQQVVNAASGILTSAADFVNSILQPNHKYSF